MKEEINLFEKYTSETKVETLKSKENFSKTFQRVFVSSLTAKIGLILSLFFLLVTIIIVIFFTIDPLLKSDDINQLSSNQYILGTDQFGRDIWSRLWYSFLITFCLAIVISFVNMVIASLVSFSINYWKKFSNFFVFLIKMLQALPSLLILTIFTLLFEESYLIIFISFILTGWSIMSVRIDQEIKKLDEQEYLWKTQTLRGKNVSGLISLFGVMFPFLIYEFFKSIPLIIIFEATIGVMGLNNENVLTIGGTLSEALWSNPINKDAIWVTTSMLVIFLVFLELFIFGINKEEFYLEKGELK
ncbi:MAG: hypothetical protein HPAVJP_5410 [Candidatus Hepatoplasma vulgare]|nr:MAG: hypothetical protein HPAVJP_5410 [Candidatus Hepatoplasma sp.]